MKKGFAAERKRESGVRTALGTMLIDKGLIDNDRLDEALRLGTESGERLGEVLVRMNWVSEEDLALVLAEQWNLRCLERSSISFDPNALAKLSREDATTLEALPMQIAHDGSLVVAVAEPTEARLFALRSRFGDRIECVVIPKTALDVGLRSELLAKTTPSRPVEAAQFGPVPTEVVADEPEVGEVGEVDEVDEADEAASFEAVVFEVPALTLVDDPQLENETEEEPVDDLPQPAAVESVPAFDEAALALGAAVEEQLDALREIVVEAVAAREQAVAKAEKAEQRAAEAEAAAAEMRTKVEEHEESIRDLQGTLRTIADRLLPPPSLS